MRDWAAAAASAAAFGIAAALCTRVAWRNFAEFRRIRTLPPLDDAEILAATPPARRRPAGWPDPATLHDHRIAAAYRDLARDVADTRALQSELLVVVGGAGLGASIGGVWHGWHAVPAYVAFAVATAGVFVSQYVAPKWTTIASRYDHRRAELSRTPVTDVTTRRRWFRLGRR